MVFCFEFPFESIFFPHETNRCSFVHTRLKCLFFEPKCTVFVYYLYKDATKLQSFQRLTSGEGVSLSAIFFYQRGLIHMERKPNAYFYHHI